MQSGRLQSLTIRGDSYAAFDSWIAAATFRLSADLQADSLAADRFLVLGASSRNTCLSQ